MKKLNEKSSMRDLKKQIEARESKLKQIYDAETALRRLLLELKRKIEELNVLYAVEGTGPVDLEDYLYHYNLTQEELNKQYSKKAGSIKTEPEME